MKIVLKENHLQIEKVRALITTFSYTYVMMNMKVLPVVTPLYIYQVGITKFCDFINICMKYNFLYFSTTACYFVKIPAKPSSQWIHKYVKEIRKFG